MRATRIVPGITPCWIDCTNCIHLTDGERVPRPLARTQANRVHARDTAPMPDLASRASSRREHRGIDAPLIPGFCPSSRRSWQIGGNQRDRSGGVHASPVDPVHGSGEREISTPQTRWNLDPAARRRVVSRQLLFGQHVHPDRHRGWRFDRREMVLTTGASVFSAVAGGQDRIDPSFREDHVLVP